jgi:hypothetical protein
MGVGQGKKGVKMLSPEFGPTCCHCGSEWVISPEFGPPGCADTGCDIDSKPG